MFDTNDSPIMLYECELWVLYNTDIIENVHMYACKRFLGSSLKASNSAVCRYPMRITATKRCVLVNNTKVTRLYMLCCVTTH